MDAILKRLFTSFLSLIAIACPLIANNAITKDTVSFPKEIAIKGKPISFNIPSKPVKHEIGIIFHNGFIVYKNTDEPLRVLDVNKKKVFAELGTWGEYPAPYFNPYICIPGNDSILCYIEDEGKIDRVNMEGKIEKTAERSYSWEHEFGGNLVGIINNFVDLGNKEWLFAGKSKNGQSIYITKNSGKKAVTEEVLPLDIEANRKDWQIYMGYFAARKDRKKAVYAYSYYHTIQFIDLDKKTMHRVNLGGKGFDYKTLYEADHHDLNAAYYRWCCPGEKYVYFLQQNGRLGNQMKKDNAKGNTYVYIEQFDWEGNPIQKIKLDKFGYFFCVDEKNSKLYLVEKRNTGSPFYEYDIPIPQ